MSGTRVTSFSQPPAPAQSPVRAGRALNRQLPAAAEDWDIVPAAGLFWACQQAPGFAIFFVAAAAFRVAGIEVEERAALEGVDGNDVPSVFGNDMRGQEVDVGGGVEIAASAFDFVFVAGAGGVGALDLHAPERDRKSVV